MTTWVENPGGSLFEGLWTWIDSGPTRVSCPLWSVHYKTPVMSHRASISGKSLLVPVSVVTSRPIVRTESVPRGVPIYRESLEILDNLETVLEKYKNSVIFGKNDRISLEKPHGWSHPPTGGPTFQLIWVVTPLFCPTPTLGPSQSMMSTTLVTSTQEGTFAPKPLDSLYTKIEIWIQSVTNDFPFTGSFMWPFSPFWISEWYASRRSCRVRGTGRGRVRDGWCLTSVVDSLCPYSCGHSKSTRPRRVCEWRELVTDRECAQTLGWFPLYNARIVGETWGIFRPMSKICSHKLLTY